MNYKTMLAVWERLRSANYGEQWGEGVYSWNSRKNVYDDFSVQLFYTDRNENDNAPVFSNTFEIIVAVHNNAAHDCIKIDCRVEVKSLFNEATMFNSVATVSTSDADTIVLDEIDKIIRFISGVDPNGDLPKSLDWRSRDMDD